MADALSAGTYGARVEEEQGVTMRGKEEKRLQRVVACICATLFALFAFLFVAVYQSPLLEAFYNNVATGKLDYNGYVLGFIVSALLTSLALWLNRFAKFRREWTALAYLPSALILAFVTDIDRSIYTGGRSYVGWIVIFAVGIIFYAASSYVLHHILFEKIKNITMSANRIIWRNLILFVLIFCMVGTLSNGEENFKREALMISRYNKGDVEGALEVGNRSLDASPELTAIRAYVLASENLMGERLFEYPQLYGSDGLLPGVVQTSPLLPDKVYALIGAEPEAAEEPLNFLRRAAYADSTNTIAREYYLNALLLEKCLPEFKDELPLLYGSFDADDLPRHYREALILVSEFDKNYTLELSSDTLAIQFAKLRETEGKYTNALERNNYVRKDFGRTYWWYYLYSKTY